MIKMKNLLKWLWMLIIVVHLTNGENIFLEGTSFQVKETQNTFNLKKLWIEVYNVSNIVGIFPLEQVRYTEIRK